MDINNLTYLIQLLKIKINSTTGGGKRAVGGFIVLITLIILAIITALKFN